MLALPPGQRADEREPRRHDSDKPVIAFPDLYVVAGNAPNLTHLMTRTTFAGATFDLLTDDLPQDVARRQPRGVRRACT